MKYLPSKWVIVPTSAVLEVSSVANGARLARQSVESTMAYLHQQAAWRFASWPSPARTFWGLVSGVVSAATTGAIDFAGGSSPGAVFYPGFSRDLAHVPNPAGLPQPAPASLVSSIIGSSRCADGRIQAIHDAVERGFVVTAIHLADAAIAADDEQMRYAVCR